MVVKIKFSGERIHELRKNAKLTQKELGSIIGVSEKTISAYERGYISPQIDRLIQLGEYFNTSLDS